MNPRSRISISEEFQGSRFNDQRLNRRLPKLAVQLSIHPMSSIPKACENFKDIKAAYRFLSNDQVLPGEIQRPHQLQTIERVSTLKKVLTIHDTSFLNYNTHFETKGLGPIGSRRASKKQSQGILFHTVFAVDPKSETPLGILHQDVWSRPERAEQGPSRRKKLSNIGLEEKESFKWTRALRAIRESLGSFSIQVIQVCDREADVGEWIAESFLSKVDFLVRAKADRTLLNGETLWKTLSQEPLAGIYQLHVPAQSKTKDRKKRNKREALLEVRFSEVRLNSKKQEQLNQYPVYALYVKETVADKNCTDEPIEWMLLSSLPVFTLSEAIEKIQWYRHRWQIESFHKVLKSCCQIEKSQLSTADGLMRLLAIKSVIAWYIYWMSRNPVVSQNASCEEFLTSPQWKALYCKIYRTRRLPNRAPPAYDAIRWIARLGGFIGRKGDGEPGMITFWRGWDRLMEIADDWILFNTC